LATILSNINALQEDFTGANVVQVERCWMHIMHRIMHIVASICFLGGCPSEICFTVDPI
jgi:hypothetical protein